MPIPTRRVLAQDLRCRMVVARRGEIVSIAQAADGKRAVTVRGFGGATFTLHWGPTVPVDVVRQ